MQLILDVDNIDVERNMSTIEQEPLNEKFLINKAVEHLPDDNTIGNKENIQKQDNIILELGEDSIIDTEKETTTSGDEILVNKLSGVKSKEDNADNEHVQTVEEIIDDKNIKTNIEEVPNIKIAENVDTELPPIEQNEVKPEKVNSINEEDGQEKESETDIVILSKNPTIDDPVIVKEFDVEKLPTKLNDEKKSQLDKENDEVESELDKENDEIESELDKEVDISELSTELNEEKEMDVDREPDTSDELTEQNKENDKNIAVDDTINMNTENKSEIEPVQNEVTNTEFDDKTQKVESSEIEPIHNDSNEKNNAIEIEDDDEKSNEKTIEVDQNIQEINKEGDKEEDKKDECELIEEVKSSQEGTTSKQSLEEPTPNKRVCRLSNNLDIFSDEEDDQPNLDLPKPNVPPETEKQCINIDDDDDIMLIDEDSSTKDSKTKELSIEVDSNSISNTAHSMPESTNQLKNDISTSIEQKPATETIDDTSPCEIENKDNMDAPVTETSKVVNKPEETEKIKKPLLPKNFINTCKKNLSDMARNDLEEFCILKIVESIVDRSNLGEIKAHLKNLTQTMEECKKKCLMLSKQNKDLQVVLKSVQEEQKSGSDVHITPLKITRSVGMQVVMVADKNNVRKKSINGLGPQAPIPNNTKQVKNQLTPNTRNQKDKAPMNQQIPVPRLVPATLPLKPIQTTLNNTITKQVNNGSLPNGVRNSPPVQKNAEKRVRSQAVTVDLTDDEPPAKIQNVQRGPISQPMRVLTTGPNILPATRFNQGINSPRKVYIPISGPQGQVRPGQTIMLKTLSGLGPRPRAPTQALISKTPSTPSPVRFRGQPSRHPAPLPEIVKQYQPPNWKALPPAPDLKLSKVENGIVISWKIEGFQEDNHEEIASYQLYAYQETSSPPNTALWKKIGDVKALPLPMACTLTQFMAGYKYYFAVRAVDIRSRFGPFSLPGSILLLNKM